jgi:hypothetical protein
MPAKPDSSLNVATAQGTPQLEAAAEKKGVENALISYLKKLFMKYGLFKQLVLPSLLRIEDVVLDECQLVSMASEGSLSCLF